MNHLFIGHEGNLYDTREKAWSNNPPLRKDYCKHFSNIENVSQLKATLRQGEYTWPGGHPMFFITSDGSALSFDSVKKEFKSVAWSIKNKTSDGWRVVACDINYENDSLFCDHSGKQIESAYGEKV